jgi:hypothetical protein
MPPVSQFPPARVFLKNAKPSSINTSSHVAAEPEIHNHVNHIAIKVSSIDTTIEWDAFVVGFETKRMKDSSILMRC